MSDYRVVHDYRARSQTSTGQGGEPVGFSPKVGKFVAKPHPGWLGVVACEVLESCAPSLLRYSWVGDEGETPTYVAYRLEPRGPLNATHLRAHALHRHPRVDRREYLAPDASEHPRRGLPALLDDLEEDGTPRASLKK